MEKRTRTLSTEMPTGATVVRFIQLPVPLDVQNSLRHHLENSNCELEKRDEGGTVEYKINCEWWEVTRTERGKNIRRHGNLVLAIPAAFWDIDADLFGVHEFTWVVDKIPEITNGILNVKIVIKTPVHGARDLVKFLFDVKDDVEYRISVLPEEIFKELKKFQKDVLKYDEERKVQHENLLAFLRPYQTRAVQWMISRECEEFQMQSPDCIYEPVHKLRSMDGTELFYYPYTDGLFKRPKPTYELPTHFRGGILADEMGLGKTVVLLGLILNNTRETIENVLVGPPFGEKKVEDEESDGPSNKKRKKDEDVRKNKKSVKCVCRDRTMRNVVQCPGCWLFQHESCIGYNDSSSIYYCSACWEIRSVKSRATLIIVPQSILQQWKDEIEKHVDDEDLKIFVYSGLGKGFVQPSVLASYDIVLTTYTVIADEFDYANLRRKSGLFLKQVPPILHVEWWRLCLDEAQMVEQGRTKEGHYIAGTMAKMISAVNKWNITGTPLQSSIDELYNLVSWIGVPLFDDERFWQSHLMDLYGKGYPVPLYSILSQIFWRNTKVEVENELTIPDISTIYHSMKFTPIELSFYMREHDAVYAKFRSQLTPGSTFLRMLAKRGMTLEKILARMLHLRQVCSHHLAVRDNEILNQGKDDEINNCMTLESLLEYLIEKNRSECIKAIKGYLDSMSRLAGLSFLMKEEDVKEAADYYKKALTTIQEYESKGFQVEILQKLHVAENLRVILMDSPGDSMNFTVDELEKMAQDLEHIYLEESMSGFWEAESGLKNQTKIVDSLQKDLKGVFDHSWASLIKTLSVGEIVKEIEKKLSEDDSGFIKIFRADMAGTIREWSENLMRNRETVTEIIEELRGADVDDLVSEAVNCHLRKKRKYCRVCNCRTVLESYKKLLFLGNTRPHNVELAMKIILKLNESKNSASRLCEKHMDLLQAIKEENKEFKAVVKALTSLISAKDKVMTSKSRKDESNADDYDELEVKLTEKSETTMSTLKKRYGTLLYLENLGKTLNGEDADDRDPCPVCFANLETKWCVLQCGHSYCTDCIKGLLKTEKNVTCPVCREITSGSDIGHVDVTKKTPEQKPVRYSTKITAIVGTLSDLKKSDPDVKVLIFSTWDVVLTVLKQALDENCISYRRLPGDNPERNLEDFKNPELKITALLFPISYGVTGLNLIEANHLFFIEPTVNMAEEQQAIARIHRMGQTKETFVHRFYMSGTIEEKIHLAVKDAKYMPKYFTLEDVQKFYNTE